MVYELLPPRRQTGNLPAIMLQRTAMSDVFGEPEQRLFGLRWIATLVRPLVGPGAPGDDVGVHGEDDARRSGLAQAGHGRMDQRRRSSEQQPRSDPEREGAMLEVAFAHGARVSQEKAVQDTHVCLPSEWDTALAPPKIHPKFPADMLDIWD